jgi:hypothetical protein
VPRGNRMPAPLWTARKITTAAEYRTGTCGPLAGPKRAERYLGIGKQTKSPVPVWATEVPPPGSRPLTHAACVRKTTEEPSSDAAGGDHCRLVRLPTAQGGGVGT